MYLLLLELLMVTFYAMFHDEEPNGGDDGDAARLESMKNWEAVVGLLRGGIDVSFDSKGEQYSEEIYRENMEERLAPVRDDPTAVILSAVLRS
jgi:hypothetical protein